MKGGLMREPLALLETAAEEGGWDAVADPPECDPAPVRAGTAEVPSWPPLYWDSWPPYAERLDEEPDWADAERAAQFWRELRVP
jgi:hypothetical protein